MNYEIPQPERENTPEAQLFNVYAMSNDQIIVLYRGLGEEVGLEDTDEQQDIGIESTMSIADPLWDQLAADVRDLASRDPERVKALVERCINSQREIDSEFAAYVVPGLISHDYEFTRDTLIDIYCDRRSLKGRPYADTGASAHDQISFLMRDHLAPEQIEDFNTRIEATVWPAIEPALPDER